MTPTHELQADVMTELLPHLLPDVLNRVTVDKQLVENVGGRWTVVTDWRAQSAYRRLHKKSKLPVSAFLWPGAEVYASCTMGKIKNNEPLLVLDWEPREPGSTAQRKVVVRCQRVSAECVSRDPRCGGCRRCVVRVREQCTPEIGVSVRDGGRVMMFEKGVPLIYRRLTTVHAIEGRTVEPGTDVAFWLVEGVDPVTLEGSTIRDRRVAGIWDWMQLYVPLSRPRSGRQLLLMGHPPPSAPSPGRPPSPDFRFLRNQLYRRRPDWVEGVLRSCASPDKCLNAAAAAPPTTASVTHGMPPEILGQTLVYVLRSRPMPVSFYVGSTENLAVRLGNHNSTSVSTCPGSEYTNVPHMQPWEVAAVVCGFPEDPRSGFSRTRLGRRLAFVFENRVHLYTGSRGAYCTKPVLQRGLLRAFAWWRAARHPTIARCGGLRQIDDEHIMSGFVPGLDLMIPLPPSIRASLSGLLIDQSPSEDFPEPTTAEIDALLSTAA